MPIHVPDKAQLASLSSTLGSAHSAATRTHASLLSDAHTQRTQQHAYDAAVRVRWERAYGEVKGRREEVEGMVKRRKEWKQVWRSMVACAYDGTRCMSCVLAPCI